MNAEIPERSLPQLGNPWATAFRRCRTFKPIPVPPGSLPGVSGFQLDFSSTNICRTRRCEPNVLVAMNPAALKVNLIDLEKGGILVVNSDEFTDGK
jgi:hypothetical protein